MTDLFNISDTVISSKYPTKNYAGSPTLNVRQASGDVIQPHFLLPMIPPFPGAVISSYTLELTPTASFATTTFNVRAASEKWNPIIVYINRPAIGGIIATLPSAGVAKTPLVFDLTALAQSWLAGTANYGIRIETTTTAAAGRSFYSANAIGSALKYRPKVVVQWSARPSTASDFVATGNRRVSVASPTIPWTYSDPAGLPMVAYQFQTNATNVWTTPTTDTGEVAATAPQYTLATPLTDGQDIWYRVRHKNSAARWSLWSDGQQVGRTIKPTVNITSPSGSVTDYTPTATWSMTGGTQTGYRAIFMKGSLILSDSKNQSGADLQYAPPKPLAAQLAESLQFVLRLRDAVDRVTTPGDPSYIEATTTFTIQTSVGVTPVSALAVAKQATGPCPRVTWTLATTPDSYLIERRVDGGVWRPFEVAPGSVALTSTTNAWVDVTAPMLRTLDYRVRPVVNGQMGNDTTIVTMPPTGPLFIWILDPDDPTWMLPVAGDDQGTLELGEQSAVVDVRGADRSYLVHEGLRGFEGTVNGLFVGALPYTDGATAQQYRDRAWRLKSEPVKLWRLVIGDMNIPVNIYQVNPVARAGVSELTFGVSFSFLQQGEVWWDV